jgi:transposase
VVQVKDARSISAEGQEALHKRAVQADLSGMKQAAAAHTFGVARGTVARWLCQYRQGGEAALNKRPQGRPPAPRLMGEQGAAIVALIERHYPDQLGLPASLLTRETVGALIKQRFGLALSVWTGGPLPEALGPDPPRSQPAGPTSRTLRRCGTGGSGVSGDPKTGQIGVLKRIDKYHFLCCEPGSRSSRSRGGNIRRALYKSITGP